MVVLFERAVCRNDAQGAAHAEVDMQGAVRVVAVQNQVFTASGDVVDDASGETVKRSAIQCLPQFGDVGTDSVDTLPFDVRRDAASGGFDFW